MKTVKNTKKMIAKRKLKDQLQKLYLRGWTNQNELAVMLGVSQPSISIYLKEIRADWKADDIETAQGRVRKHIKASELSMVQAATEFEVSKTKTKYANCGDCKGKGWIPQQGVCESCQGEGRIETVIRVPGDPAYLKVINDCIERCAKLDGSFPDKPRRTKVKEEHLHLHEGAKVLNLYAGASNEDLLDMREQLDRLRIKSEGNGNGATIEVESEEVEVE